MQNYSIIMTELRKLAGFYGMRNEDRIIAYAHDLDDFDLNAVLEGLRKAKYEFDTFPPLSRLCALINGLTHAKQKQESRDFAKLNHFNEHEQSTILKTISEAFRENRLERLTHLNTIQINGCRHCNESGLIWAKNGHYEYCFKCFCPTGQARHELFETWGRRFMDDGFTKIN